MTEATRQRCQNASQCRDDAAPPVRCPCCITVEICALRDEAPFLARSLQSLPRMENGAARDHESAIHGHRAQAYPKLTRALIRPRTYTQRVTRALLVLAGSAFVAGLLVGPRVMRFGGESRAQVTKRKLDALVFEAYPSWAAEHPDQTCPADLAELAAYTNSEAVDDMWGRPLTLLCSPTRSSRVHVIAIISDGPDQRARTDDDVMAWQ